MASGASLRSALQRFHDRVRHKRFVTKFQKRTANYRGANPNGRIGAVSNICRTAFERPLRGLSCGSQGLPCRVACRRFAAIETGSADAEISASLANIANLIGVPENTQLVACIALELVHRLHPSCPTGRLEEPPHSDGLVIHWFGDLREAANARTGRVLGHRRAL